jgi:hypothetical protein
MPQWPRFHVVIFPRVLCTVGLRTSLACDWAEDQRENIFVYETWGYNLHVHMINRQT